MKRTKPARLDLRGRLALRIDETAETLGLSERKVREMLPELPHVRHRGVVMIPVDLLGEWLRACARIEGDRVGGAVEEVLRDLGTGS